MATASQSTLHGTADTAGKSSGKATAALGLGIIALVVSWVPIAAWVLGAIGIGLAVAAKSDIRNRGLGGSGLATAGLTLAIIAIVIGTGIFVAALATA